MATRHQNRGFARTERIAEQIRRDLAEIIKGELKDPRIGMISLSGVEVTPDYAHATVHFTTLADAAAIGEIEKGLKRAAGFLRVELGRRLRIHQIPELHFRFDPSLERGMALSRLIDVANATRAAD
jgi:ribosome-binding factor A